MGGGSSETTGLVRKGAGMRRLMYAGIVASMVLAVVALQSVGQGPTSLDEISWPWMQEGGGQGAVDFAWDNQNVDMFEEGCKTGNQKACDSLAASGEALKILNERSRDGGDKMLVAYVPEGESEEDGGSDLAAGPMGWDQNKVPLAYPIDQSDLAGAGDVGNALVSKDDPWAKKKKQAGMYGYPTQLSLLRQAAGQGLARKPFYTATDPCRPNGPLCGPTRPAEDHGGDVVLTKGWLGEPEEFPCCPCVGKGVKTINYADYPGAGFYNPYTMEMCQLCDGCSLYGKE